MVYYTGEIKKMYIKKININEDAEQIITDTYVIKKDAPFYLNFLGRFVSFEHGTYLATRAEAKNVLLSIATNEPENAGNIACMFADYENFSGNYISKKDFKQMKKTYKKIRKDNEK